MTIQKNPRDILVLLVDDNPRTLLLHTQMLYACGVTVLQALSGDKAIERVEEVPNRINAVFSDLHMPKMTGLELRDELHSQMLDLGDASVDERFAFVTSASRASVDEISVRPVHHHVFKPLHRESVDSHEAFLKVLQTMFPEHFPAMAEDRLDN